MASVLLPAVGLSCLFLLDVFLVTMCFLLIFQLFGI